MKCNDCGNELILTSEIPILELKKTLPWFADNFKEEFFSENPDRKISLFECDQCELTNIEINDGGKIFGCAHK